MLRLHDPLLSLFRPNLSQPVKCLSSLLIAGSGGLHAGPHQEAGYELTHSFNLLPSIFIFATDLFAGGNGG